MINEKTLSLASICFLSLFTAPVFILEAEEDEEDWEKNNVQHNRFIILAKMILEVYIAQHSS